MPEAGQSPAVYVCHAASLSPDTCDRGTRQPFKVLVSTGILGYPSRVGVVFRLQAISSNGEPGAWVRFDDGIEWHIPMSEVTLIPE